MHHLSAGGAPWLPPKKHYPAARLENAAEFSTRFVAVEPMKRLPGGHEVDNVGNLSYIPAMIKFENSLTSR